MKFRILKLSLNGIKNFEKEVELKFSRDNINNKTYLDEGKIKSLYGGNGSGKTAIILGLWIMKLITSKSNYLLNDSDKADLSNLINKKKRSFEGSLIFESINDDGSLNGIYKYSLKISMESDNSIKVSNESLLKLKKNKNISTASYETIFDVKEGNLVCLMLNINEDIKEKIIEKTKNLLSFSSLLSLIKKENKSASEKTDEENSFYLNDKDILNPIAFFSNLFFFFHKEDEARRNTDNYHLKLNIVKELRDSFIFPDNVKKSLISEYETHLKNLCSFLKIFKKEILKITYEKEEDSDYYRCNKYIVYKNYRIEPTYESAGIKKLIHLYNALKRAIDGKIVLIDELDTHINTIYLNKFLLFFKQYGEGQLIFTSHNLEPMDVLETQVPTSTKPLKYSIDFIDDNQNLVPWVKNGHYHAHSQYYDGAIKGSPFNIEPDDFASCFFSKKTEKGRD